MAIWPYGRERNGILGSMLNTHPMALKHLMPALMHFYIGAVHDYFPTHALTNVFQRSSKLVLAPSSMISSVRDTLHPFECLTMN